MKDIKDNFIPYEEAKELKELGFNDRCFGYYYPEYSNELYHAKFDCTTKPIIIKPSDFVYYAPLWQQAFEFFRVKYQYFSYVIHHSDNTYGWKIDDNVSYIDFTDGFYKSYEDAQLECLRKLIRITKSN